MDYTFDTYRDGYIDAQFEIGSLKYDMWRMGGQTRKQQLEATYSAPEFDPETRFYAFHEGKMVAFLTSSEKDADKKEAYFEFPYYLPGHKAVIDPLVQYSFEKLRAKGFKTLITRAGPYWGNTKRLADHYGFFFVSDIARAGIIELDEFDERNLVEPKGVIPYNYERDIDELSEIFSKKFQVPIETMKQNLSRFKDLKVGGSVKNPWDQKLTLISNVVARLGGKLVGRGVVMNVESFGSKTANLISFHIEENRNDIKQQIVRKLLEDCRSQEYHRLVIHTGLWGVHADDSYFEEFGIKFNPKLSYYHKNL